MIETFKRLWAAGIAYLALLLGAGLSVAGNVADTFRTRGPLTDGLDIIMAAAWPILVLVTIELFVSRLWATSRGYQALRWTGCLAIGTMAMLVSWVHLHDLLATRGQLTAVAIVGPLAIDGMAIMATGLILSTRTGVAVLVQDVPAETDADVPIHPTYQETQADMWKRLEDEMGGYQPISPAYAAAPVSGAPALARSNEVKPESIPRLARLEILAEAEAGAPAGRVITTLAEAHGVSTRTGRRWRDAVLKA